MFMKNEDHNDDDLDNNGPEDDAWTTDQPFADHDNNNGGDQHAQCLLDHIRWGG